VNGKPAPADKMNVELLWKESGEIRTQEMEWEEMGSI
jgi:hypothetical protein